MKTESIEEYYADACDLLSEVTASGEPIDFDEYELFIIISGGVRPRDIEFGINALINAPSAPSIRQNNPWGYIRTVALNKRAQLIRLSYEESQYVADPKNVCREKVK